MDTQKAPPSTALAEGGANSDAAPLGPGSPPGLPVKFERMLLPREVIQTEMPAGMDSAQIDKAPRQNRPRRIAVVTFFLLVFLPVIMIAGYLFSLAEDQYASTTGFTVQREEGGGAAELFGGLVGFGMSSGASDTDILAEFIQSQDLVVRVNERLDLQSHYAQHWDGPLYGSDKVFSLWPDASVEDLVWFWKRVIRISYDKSTGLIELRVLAFDPNYAQSVAQEIVTASQDMINAMSEAAREDATRYAEADLEAALQRLTTARQNLTTFRSRTQIVDPLADLESRMGVMANLQNQLAEALVEYDLLQGTTRVSDVRLQQAERKIDAIKARIAAERNAIASVQDGQVQSGEDYPALLSEYERLSVDLQYAEETFRAAQTALDLARANAARQTRYLAMYIEPTLAQDAEFPRRFTLLTFSILFCLMTWAVLVLTYHAIRERQ